MISLLEDKNVIFFDVGYTLDRPASGDWLFTNRFLELAGKRLKLHSDEEIREAREAGIRFLNQDHLLTSVEAEYRQFVRFARDRAYNMTNYIPYPGIREVLETLGKTHKLGVISDTWPSIVPQLDYLGVSQYFSFTTFSCSLGTVKPDKRMYLDALGKAGVPAEETVFIDDSVHNLEGAAALGITPILIAANPASDVDTVYLKIHDLRELIRDSNI